MPKSPDLSTLRQAPPDGARRSVPRLTWCDSRGPQSAVIERTTLVGSASRAQLVVADRGVSRLHAEIEPSGEGLRVRDLGSTNGTWAGGIRIGEAWIPYGSRLRLGPVEVSLTTTETAPEDLSTADSFGGLLGNAPPMRRLFSEMAHVAESQATVLIQGATGTGKELCARAIHDASPRREAPFVVIDCAALPETLLESELFGHVRGAFTGATAPRPGAFEEAHGGTVFLDEVGELSLPMQPRLLRVLESRTVRRLGETRQRPIDVRVVAATHRDLGRMVVCGAFREDLYFRLAVLPLRMPSLAERSIDIPALLSAFLGRPADQVYGAELLGALMAMPWLGNVRELRNFADRTLALGIDAALALVSALGERPSLAPLAAPSRDARTVPPALAVSAPDADPAVAMPPFREYRERWIDRGEADYIHRLLTRHGSDVTAAAREAGLNRSHVYRLIKKHGG